MTEIEVERAAQEGNGERERSRFRVRVAEGESTSQHEVTLAARELERLGGAYGSAEEFVRACFGFLLEREPKESILPTFDISVISTYFPEFEQTIARPM